ncbi:hypothetical protein ABZP36_025661 [Zizania latifolia]
MKASSQSQSPRTPSPRTVAQEHTRSSSEPWLVAAAVASSCDDSCVNDVENFARTVAAAKARMGSAGSSSRPDMLASVLSHYAAKWLPDVAAASSSPASSASGRFLPPGSPIATWLKKRLLLESLATLGAVMIPAFGHEYACGTLLDVPLVLRLVRGFLKEGAPAKAGAAAAARVARLIEMPPKKKTRGNMFLCSLHFYRFPVKCQHYNAGFTCCDKSALPLAEEKRFGGNHGILCEINRNVVVWLDASGAPEYQQGETEVALNRLAERTGSFTAPSPALDLPGARCPSKRDVLAQHHEVRRLREDLARLQVQCSALQAQVDRLSSEKRRRGGGGGGFFKWSSFWFGGMSADVARVDDSESGVGRRTPARGKKGRAAAATPTPKWRKSMSSAKSETTC